MLQWSYTTILWCISVEQMKVGGVRDSLIKFMLNPLACQSGCVFGPRKLQQFSQLGCDDGNFSVFLGPSSVSMLKTLLTADDTTELDQGSSLLFNQW